MARYPNIDIKGNLQFQVVKKYLKKRKMTLSKITLHFLMILQLVFWPLQRQDLGEQLE